MRALTSSDSNYGIRNVRRLTERESERYIPEVRGRLFFSQPGDPIELPGLSWTDLTDRESDGSYVSGSTILYLINEEDEARFVALSTEREAKRQAARGAERVPYKPTGNRYTRPCPRCETYCYGDCTAN